MTIIRTTDPTQEILSLIETNILPEFKMYVFVCSLIRKILSDQNTIEFTAKNY